MFTPTTRDSAGNSLIVYQGAALPLIGERFDESASSSDPTTLEAARVRRADYDALWSPPKRLDSGPQPAIDATQLVASDASDFRVWASSCVGDKQTIEKRFAFLDMVSRERIGIVVGLENNLIAPTWLDGPSLTYNEDRIADDEFIDNLTQYAPDWPFGKPVFASGGGGMVASASSADGPGGAMMGDEPRVTMALNKSVLVRLIDVVVVADEERWRRRKKSGGSVVGSSSPSLPPSKHRFVHIIYRYWPDNGTPTYPADLLDMLYFIYMLQSQPLNRVPPNVESMQSLVQADPSRGFQASSMRHMLVHCAAGIGRTGVFLTLWRCMLPQDPVPALVDQVIVAMRSRRRHRMVYTFAQYRFIKVMLYLMSISPALQAIFYGSDIYAQRYKESKRDRAVDGLFAEPMALLHTASSSSVMSMSTLPSSSSSSFSSFFSPSAASSSAVYSSPSRDSSSRFGSASIRRIQFGDEADESSSAPQPLVVMRRGPHSQASSLPFVSQLAATSSMAIASGWMSGESHAHMAAAPAPLSFASPSSSSSLFSPSYSLSMAAPSPSSSSISAVPRLPPPRGSSSSSSSSSSNASASSSSGTNRPRPKPNLGGGAKSATSAPSMAITLEDEVAATHTSPKQSRYRSAGKR
ncbi:MAG: protein-tyrosine phosphatase family protein [Candidatus Paceibacterota bacterium]|jgi:hypothetical protein